MARKKETMSTKKAVHLIISISGIMVMLGISWLSAALTITVREVNLAGQVIFVISTSFQGFYLFLFLCILNQEARESWRELLSGGRYKSTFLNPTLKKSKISSSENRDPNKYQYTSHHASTDYSSRTATTSLLSSSKTRSSGVDSEYFDKEDESSVSNIYSQPAHSDEEVKKKDMSEIIDQKDKSHESSSKPAHCGREEEKRDVSNDLNMKKPNNTNDSELDELLGISFQPDETRAEVVETKIDQGDDKRGVKEVSVEVDEIFIEFTDKDI